MSDVNEHLASASEEDAKAYRSVSRVLRAASPLNRAVCPSREDLLASEAELGEQRTTARSAHLAACPLCREDLRDFAALSEVPAPSLVAQTVATVRATVVLALDAAGRALELIESSLTPVSLPELAPARGGETAPSALGAQVPFGAGKLEIQWAPARGAVDLRTVALQGAPQTYRIVLRRPGGGIYESRTSDEVGNAHLSGLTPDTYTLCLYAPQARRPDVEIELDLRPA